MPQFPSEETGATHSAVLSISRTASYRMKSIWHRAWRPQALIKGTAALCPALTSLRPINSGLAHAVILMGSTQTLLLPRVRRPWVGNAGPALGWASGDPGTCPPPRVRADPRQLSHKGQKHVLVLKHPECLGAGYQEGVGRSQHWGGASPWGDRVSRQPPCQT